MFGIYVFTIEHVRQPGVIRVAVVHESREQARAALLEQKPWLREPGYAVLPETQTFVATPGQILHLQSR